jgi:predicted nucleotidyltransferase
MSSEVWLYGSAARGDTDSLSDVDVLVAGKPDAAVLLQLPYRRPQLSVVQYDWEELELMASYGSLFLHHVRLEGQPMRAEGESRLSALLDGLPHYDRAARELASFVSVLDDVESSLAGDHSPAFELSVIATALRHSCILGCYAIGRPTFGRVSAFEVFLTHGGFDALLEEVQQLYFFRLHEDLRAPAPFEATTDDVRLWLSRTRKVVAAVERALDDCV